MLTQTFIKVLKDNLQKAGILNEQISKKLDTASNFKLPHATNFSDWMNY
jgi:hypothetical protein